MKEDFLCGSDGKDFDHCVENHISERKTLFAVINDAHELVNRGGGVDEIKQFKPHSARFTTSSDVHCFHSKDFIVFLKKSLVSRLLRTSRVLRVVNQRILNCKLGEYSDSN